MNYVILNGCKSTTIKGLLIQSLPPISKPLMRTSVQEIDGRDGDIVTKLGYSAYDKQMSIGLFGDYDVDEVIQFFDSQGTVTFSNEPDKFYNYQIIQQIDFARLIRFKTAIVTFHVQPFKYSAVDDAFTFSNDDESDSFTIFNRGNIVSRPTFTIYGSGTINLSINGTELFTINLGDAGFITLDGAQMNAYQGDILMNRYVVGDYNNLRFNIGTNTVSWTGTVSQIKVENYARWI